MRSLLILLLLALAACNPELQQVGSHSTDVVKYFRIVKTEDPKALGEGILIVAHAGNKRILSYYLKSAGGFAHTDVTLDQKEGGYVLDSVYSQTPKCKLEPQYEQGDYFSELLINGESRPYKLESIEREAGMKMLTKISC